MLDCSSLQMIIYIFGLGMIQEAAPFVPRIEYPEDTRHYDPYVVGETTDLSYSHHNLHAELFDLF